MELIPGKRYRWTVEGAAIVAARGIVLDTGNATYKVNPGYGELELLPDPLPTNPGSVARGEGNRLYFLNRQACWLDEWGDVAKSSELANATVLFDAGAER